MYKKDLDFMLKGKDIPYFFMFYGEGTLKTGQSGVTCFGIYFTGFSAYSYV